MRAAAARVYRWAGIPYTLPGHGAGAGGAAHAKQALDVYVCPPPPHTPRQPLQPVVLFVHGGGWQRGDRDAGPAGLYRNVGAALARRGLTVVVPSYRLHPHANYQASLADLAAAAGWAAAHAARYGGDARDGLWLAGHSAGAHLTALLAAQRHWLALLPATAPPAPPVAVAGYVGLCGVYDLGALAAAPLGAALFTTPVFGEDPEALARASPVHSLEAGSRLATRPALLLNAEDDFHLERDAEALDAAIAAAAAVGQGGGVAGAAAGGEGGGGTHAAARTHGDPYSHHHAVGAEALWLGEGGAGAAAAAAAGTSPPRTLQPTTPPLHGGGRLVALPSRSPTVTRARLTGANHFSLVTGMGRGLGDAGDGPGEADPVSDAIAEFVHRHGGGRH